MTHAVPTVLGTLTPAAMVGDANGDGIANALDLTIVNQNLNKAGGKAQGDFDGNGMVNAADLTLLQNNFQKRMPSAYFGKIADTTTAVPAGTGAFNLLNAPVIDRSSNLAFVGSGPTTYGVYRWSAGALTKIADSNTTIPSGNGAFTNFGRPSISGGNLIFQGVGTNQEGVYSFANGVITKLLNKSSVRPEGDTFASFGDPVMSGAAVALVATGATASAYSLAGSAVTTVANTTTAIPGGTGNFTGFDNAISDGTNFWFIGQGSSLQLGIYRKTGNTLTTLLDKKTPIPGTSQKFSSVGNLSEDGPSLSFNGMFGGRSGVFSLNASGIVKMADTRTGVPGGTGRFSSFGITSTGGSSVAFVGYDQNMNVGLYSWINGELSRIIDNSVTLGGRIISSINLSRDAVIGNKVVFSADFTDGTSALYSSSLLRTWAPGDVNNDGIADDKDFSIIQKNQGLSGGHSQGDLNGDGLVDFKDFQVLEKNYGRTGSPTLIGDADGDGKVDVNDMNIFFANNGKYGGLPQGDFSGDGKVDFRDYQMLELGFGKTLAGAYEPFGSASGADVAFAESVPEPTGVMLLAGALALASRRRRRAV